MKATKIDKSMIAICFSEDPYIVHEIVTQLAEMIKGLAYLKAYSSDEYKMQGED